MLDYFKSFGFIFFLSFCLYCFAWCSDQADQLEACGNARLDEGEQCDGDIVPKNCYLLYYSYGTLRCSDDCTYNISDCR
jgi:hypothetical protein